VITKTKRPKTKARTRGAMQRRPFGRIEQLEDRDLLSVSVERTSLNLRFSIDNKNPDRPDSEYQTFAVTNNEVAALNNVWVQVTVADPDQSVQLAPNEDGLYFLGNLDPGETDTAFIYFYGKVVTAIPDPQPFEIKVWKDGEPGTGTEVPVTFTGPDPAATAVFQWVAGSEGDNDGSVTESVTTTYSFGGSPSPVPVVGGTMTMVVTGRVKNNADRILYSPATNRNWPADTFVLDAVQVTYPDAIPPDPVALPLDSLFEKPIVGNPKDFVATYTFRIEGTTPTSTPVTARQWTAAGAIGNRKFDHSRLIGTEVPIPPPVYRTALEIAKTGTTVAMAGSVTTYSYTITVTSTGVDPAEDVEVDDVWPAQFTGRTYIKPAGTTVDDTPTGFTWNIGTLAAGTSKSLVINFTVPKATPLATYTNTATVRSTTPNPNPKTASIATTVVDLAITKAANTTPVVAGSSDVYWFSITVQNPSPTFDLSDVVVTDTWPAAFVIQSFVGPGTTTRIGDTITWTLDTLARGSSATLRINYTVPSGTALTTYTNVAAVTSEQGTPVPNETSATVTVVDVPLTITKSPNVTVVAGSPFVQSYEIVVTNTTASKAEGVVVKDIWPVAFPRQTISPPAGTTITDSQPTEFTWTIGTMNAGQTYKLIVNYTVPKATASATYTNTANLTSTTGAPRSASATTTVFDLLITKAALPTTVPAGSSTERTFVITVQNTSPTLDLTNVVVNDTWPVPFVITGFTGDGTTQIIGTNFRWTLPTLLRSSSKTLTVRYTVPKATPLTTYTNTAAVTSTQGTPVPNTAPATVTVVPVDLTIAKVGKTATVKAGTTGEWYDIIVTNTSTRFAAENVQVVDTWPVGFTQVGFSDPGAVTPLGGGNFRWNIGTLAAGAPPAVLRVFFDVPSSAALKLYSNFATVSSNTQDPGEKTAEADTLVVAGNVRAGVVVCTDDGCDPAWVRVLDADGNLQSPQSQFQPYGNIRGGLRVTAADVNGDGVEEVIVAPGLGVRGPVRVLTTTGLPVPGFPDFYPYGPAWTNGIELAAADINNDGREDLITGMSLGVGTVNVYRTNMGFTLVNSFRGAPAGYAGGVRIAAADFGTYENGVLVSPSLDGKAEVVVGTNAGITAQVRIFDVQPVVPKLARTIIPFGTAFTGGVSLSTGNYDGDPAHISDILVGAGIGGRSVVKVFNAQTGAAVPDGTLEVFSSFTKANALVNVAPVDFDFDGTIDRLYGVQGRGGAGGTTGIRRVMLPSKTSTQLTSYAPTMRIAPINLAASMLSRSAGARVRAR